MKKLFYPAIIAVFAASCASSNVEPNVSSKTEISNSAKPNAVNLPTNSVFNSVAPPITQANSSPENSTELNKTIIDSSSVSRRNLERLRSKGNPAANAAPMPSNKPEPYIAPDKSEISTMMNEKGVPVETRIFRNHPILAKTEKTFADVENPVLKVYLKNGKVLTVPKGAIKDQLKASADEFLKAVGVNP